MSRPLLADDPRRLGDWELTARLGEGGFGVVYEAHDGQGRHGAVKVMHRHLSTEADYVARFGREVALAQRVRGEHVARVLDYDLDASPPFLVTEFVDGPTLHDEVARTGGLTGDNLYALALALAEAIASIAAAGVVHRDLKPGNVLLTTRTPIVVDFGIAAGAGLGRLTSTGLVMGTAPYMAPEQFTGGDANPAIDVFAWASVVCFAATGRPPFHEETGNASAVMYQVLHADPDHGALPPTLAGLVAAAHAKDPAARPTAAELVDRLVAVRAPAADDPVRTSVMLIERTWHLAAPPPPPPPPLATPTPVKPAPVPTTVSPPRPSTEPARPARLVVAPFDDPVDVTYTPPRSAPPAARPAAPSPAAPPPAAPPPVATRYPANWVATWVHELPDFGRIGALCGLAYLGVGFAYDRIDDGVPLTTIEQGQMDDLWDVIWALRPLVLFTVVAFVVQRALRASVLRRGLTRGEWRGFAVGSATLGVVLSLLPAAALTIVAYGPVVLEPNDRLTTTEAVVAGAGALVLAVIALIGLVFAVRAVTHVVRALFGMVVWRG